MLEIKSYQPDFVDRQVEIGTKVIGKWSFGGQTTKEQLEENYSREEFDPETRLYAFKGEEMVGFLPSSVQAQQENEPLMARLELPLTEEGHEDARDELFSTAVEVLKSKGVEVIRTRAGPAWGYTADFAKSKGFEQTTPIIRQGTYDYSGFEDKEYRFKAKDFNLETDLDMIAKMFKSFYNISDEQVEGVLNQLKTGTGVEFISHKIIVDDGVIVGRLTAYHRPNSTEILLGTLISFEGENQKTIEEDLIHAVLKDVKSQGHDHVTITLSGANINADDKYSGIDIQFAEALSFYELKL